MKTSRKEERAHNILRRRPRPLLEAMFAPKQVAVIGATERPDSVGRTIFENLLAGSLRDAVHPVNPNYTSVLGINAFPTIAAVPFPVDLAVVVTPAKSVPGIIAECADAGVSGAIVISAGFKECGPEGAELERQILANAAGRMRIIGPNCLGVMVPHLQLNASFAANMALPGSVAFISQSGALCTAILDWSLAQNVGFSAFVSIGSMVDVGWGDLIDYLGDDPHTKSIVAYMETIGDARAFLSAAREVALSKPVILIKVGRTVPAARAAASHTGSLAGDDDVVSAAFRRAGVLRVETISELFDMAEVLGKQPRPAGPRLAIVTNAGGPAALATDQLIVSGGKTAGLSQQTVGCLEQLLPPFWSKGNPVDILGDANAERYAKAVEIISKDPSNDGVLVILTPQAMTEATPTAEQLKRFAKLDGKPILASWMGGPAVEQGTAVLCEANIPVYSYPDTAARVFCLMSQYSENLRALYETPSLGPVSDETIENRAGASKLIEAARQQHRTMLTEVESKEILAAYGIPTIQTHVAHTEEEAVALAKQIDGPAVLKVYSDTVTHKTDVGGVMLDLRTSRAVRLAWRKIQESVIEKLGPLAFQGVTVQPMVKLAGSYELIVGSSTDPQFGPVLLFGAGGELVEIFKDRVLALPPLNATLARRAMERTRIYTALRGIRGRHAVDITALEQLFVRFSHLIAEQSWIAESDMNPLLVSPEKCLALDARIILHGHEVAAPPRLSIRPYPAQYVTQWTLSDGTPLTIRPIRPEDELMMVKFHRTLSDRSVHARYCAMLKLDYRIAHERLTRICFNDYDREIALVADRKTPGTGEHEILGVGRLSRLHGVNEGEFAIVISDQWQGHHLGTRLLDLLIQVGRSEKLNRISGHILPDNTEMLYLTKKAGFKLTLATDGTEYTASIALS